MATPSNTGGTPPRSPDDKATPGPQASAEGNTNGADPNGHSPPKDPTTPSDPDPSKSVGGANPSQPPAGDPAAPLGTGADQINRNTLIDNLAPGAETPMVAASAVIPGVVPLPSEGGGFCPIPHPDTGSADSNEVGYTQATQRLVHPDDQHPIAQALGTVTNIPPGSRPVMMDTATGRGLVPPQAGKPAAD